MIFSLRQTGTSLSGTITVNDPSLGTYGSGSSSARGSVSGRDVRITATNADGEMTLSGTVSADCRSFTVSMTLEGESMTMTFRRR